MRGYAGVHMNELMAACIYIYILCLRKKQTSKTWNARKYNDIFLATSIFCSSSCYIPPPLPHTGHLHKSQHSVTATAAVPKPPHAPQWVTTACTACSHDMVTNQPKNVSLLGRLPCLSYSIFIKLNIHHIYSPFKLFIILIF